MKKKVIALLLASMFVVVGVLAACNPPDDGEVMDLKMMVQINDNDQRISYQQDSPLDLSTIGGPYVEKGDIKPMWQYVGKQLNVNFIDSITSKESGKDMLSTNNTNNFADAQIFGGNSLNTDLMGYGAQGKFVDLKKYLDAGKMPNFQAYLDANAGIESSITAYDGGIYFIPYVAEVGEFARNFIVDTNMTDRLFAAGAEYSTANIAGKADTYQGFYVGSNERTGSNGGTVVPQEGVSIVKKTSQNIITIQNNLTTKTGKTYMEALIKYINDNYSYSNPAELYVGEKAAYDIDELVALWRCIKYNPVTSSGNPAATTDTVWGYFVRQESYREEFLRLATYFGGVKVNGTDSYNERWYIDADGELQYTYTQEEFFDVLLHLSDIVAEGLVDTTALAIGKATGDAYRKTFCQNTNNEYAFMTYDFLASSTAQTSFGKINANVILPPVAKVNGVWQYYMDNSRVIKNDGWGISVAGTTEAQRDKAIELFDYFFSDEGYVVQNYGMPYLLDSGLFTGPDGKQYPKYKAEVLELLGIAAGSDGSKALRARLGVLLPIGYSKEIGFEYQYTVQNGIDGWALLKGSTVGIPTYAGEGKQPSTGGNPNYYKLTPSAYSFTARQTDALNTKTQMTASGDAISNYIFSIVRNQSGAPETFEDYWKWFKDKGVELFVVTYQDAFYEMTNG